MRLGILVVLVMLGASCVQSSTVTCGALTCQAGAVCSPNGDACTTQTAIDACKGQELYGACTADGGRAGACHDAYCQEIRCGDGVFDPIAEMCDDGNTADRDGCSADCKSDETCGNNVRDPATEECDDGNLVSNDGCTASCVSEVPLWHEVIDTRFHGRELHSIAYDIQRKRIVMFGGGDGTTGMASNETWEYDGLEWIKRSPATSPSARKSASMAYDAARHVTVLFGGFDDTDRLADTWEWDGTNWTLKTPTNFPSKRFLAGMAFLPSRNVIVLYGGASGPTDSSETWEYDGTNWTDRTAVLGSANPGKLVAPLAYDPGIAGVIEFGADGTQDTWKYDGTWTKLTVTGALPRIRSGYSLAYDASVGHTLIEGGRGTGAPGDCGGAAFCADAYELESNGSGGYKWTSIFAPYVPTDAVMAYQADAQQLVIMGGREALSQTAPEDATWYRHAGAWTHLHSPAARSACQIAYSPKLGGTVLYGGPGLADTWLLRDGHWSALHPSTSPAITVSTSMALDRNRGKLVIVDGTNATWELDGTDPTNVTWTKVATAHAPPPREGFQLAYDESRSAVILFGGSVPKVSLLADTWSYDGTDWTQLSPTTSPSARAGFAMTYDVARSAVVLFGNGFTDAATWELGASTWTMSPATGPSPRVGMTFAYDRLRAAEILFGGATAGIVNTNETWEYRAGTWHQLTTIAPPPRNSACSTYDETLKKTVVFGGYSPTTGAMADTWLFGYE